MTTFTHKLLVVRELDASISFFEEYGGLSLLHRRDRADPQQHIAWLGSNAAAARIILAQGPAPESAIGPYGHIGLSCPTESEYRGLLAKAQAAGLIERGPQSQPWPICDWFSILDPDGNRIEVSFGQDAELPDEHDGGSDA